MCAPRVPRSGGGGATCEAEKRKIVSRDFPVNISQLLLIPQVLHFQDHMCVGRAHPRDDIGTPDTSEVSADRLGVGAQTIR